MTDENTNEPDWDELFYNQLKKLSTEQIEKIIGDAIGKAMGSGFNADLSEIKFLGSTGDGAELKLTISKKREPTPF